MLGVRLELLRPDAASRPCGDCRRWLYHDTPDRFGDAVVRGGRPVARPPGCPTPCSYCPKQPADVPDHARRPETAVELSDKNARAVAFSRECRAVGRWPDDALVRRNAAVVAEAERSAERVTQARLAVLSRRT
jgi:hypothetical protein